MSEAFTITPKYPATGVAFKFGATETLDGVSRPVSYLYMAVFDRATRKPVGLSLEIDGDRYVIPIVPYDDDVHMSAITGTDEMREWLSVGGSTCKGQLQP